MNVLLCVSPPVHGQSSERIVSFDTVYDVRPNGTVEVSERIGYDFGTEQRHGIIRRIPYTIENDDGNRYAMDISVLSVTDGQRNEYPFDLTEEASNYITIKIGDPDRYVTGLVTYDIRYTVSGALRYFSDHDELYWNATGNEWDVEIASATATVRLPDTVSLADTEATAAAAVRATCYTGYTRSGEQQCLASVEGRSALITASYPLPALYGMTFAVAFPKGAVAVLEPERIVPFFETALGKIIGIGLAVAAFLWYLIYPVWLGVKWFLFGRDPHVGKPVSAWFDPPTTTAGRPLTPAETGTLLDEKVEKRDIAAMMVDLARRGFYRIVEDKNGGFSFEKRKGYEKDETVMKDEQRLLKALFRDGDTVSLDDAELAGTVSDISDSLYAGLTREGFFPENPEMVRRYYAAMMGVAGITFNLPLLLSGALFGANMARKTIRGAQAANVARGMKSFLQSQERQLNFQGDKRLLFEKLLPFAVAFGVERTWAERFKDVVLTEPDWYRGNYSTFDTVRFSNSLHSSVNTFSSSATPVATVSSTGSSSGFSGGSSGGGGGGGGGSSW
jgi:hypothetical protein